MTADGVPVRNLPPKQERTEIMRTVVAALAIVGMMAMVDTAGAATRVKPYVRKDGTYVQPHWRSSPNSTRLDNYSSKGNVNPFTGKKGTKQ
jgi:hypothetical protein